MAVTNLTQLGPNVKNYSAVDQGNYFVATNPTPGTGIASGSVTSLADTTPLMVIKNNNSVSSKIRIYLDALRLTVSSAGGGGTTRFLTSKLDTSQSTTRYTSGGTVIGAGINCNADSGNASQAQVYFGAITAAAAGNARLIGHLTLREIIEIVQDTFVIDYGPSVGQPTAALATGGTATVARYFQHPPVVIGPQEHYLLHYWGGSLTTASFEFVLGWTEV